MTSENIILNFELLNGIWVFYALLIYAVSLSLSHFLWSETLKSSAYFFLAIILEWFQFRQVLSRYMKDPTHTKSPIVYHNGRNLR